MWRDSLRDAFHFDHEGVYLDRALLSSVALFLLLLYGDLGSQPQLVLFPVVGAFVAGFGPLRAMGGSHATHLIWAALGMSLTTGLGMLLGHGTVSTLASLLVAGLAFGLLHGLGSATAWVALQCLVFLIILGLPYPSDLSQAFSRASLVFGGGLLQLLLLSVFRLLGLFVSDGPWLHPWRHVASDARVKARAFRVAPMKRADAWNYGLRMGLVLMAAFVVSARLAMPRSPWVLMTVALVFRPDFRQTVTRGLARCTGTLLGGAVATAVVALGQPGPLALSLFAVISGFFAYLFLYANYGLCTTFITSFVVFLLSFEGLPGLEMVHWRIMATLLGGLFAFLAWVPWRSGSGANPGDKVAPGWEGERDGR